MNTADNNTDKPLTKAQIAEAERLAAEQRDQVGAVLAPADAMAAPNVAETVAATEEAKNEWARVLIVAGAPDRMPAKDDRKVIVVELPGEAGLGAIYPKTADAYLGYAREEGADPVFPFETAAPIYLMGGNVRQQGFRGMSKVSGYLAVGPAHPVYAALNLALQQGATDVKIVGLSDAEKVTLRPWFEEVRPQFETLEYGG